MEKITIDGKEAVFDESCVKPLSEEDLERTNGGAGETGHNYSRLVCLDCGYASWWNFRSQDRNYIVNFHYSLTGHYQYITEKKYFDSDPNATPAG